MQPMNRRLENSGERGEIIRRIIRLLTVLCSLSVITWLLVSFNPGPRSQLFETVSTAEAVERTGSELGRLKILNRCVSYVRSDYVVPERIRPMRMLIGALKAAEAMIPDLMITPNASEPENVKSLTVRMGDHTKNFNVEGTKDLYEMNWKLLEIFDYISRYLTSDIKADEVEYAAINGLLSPLDEHSVFLSPKAYKEMLLDTQGHFGGLGIVITTRKGVVVIVSVLPDTPAAKAGLRSGDRIIEINDESTVNMLLDEAVSKLRGEPGTKVTILVQRAEWTVPRTIELTRADIRIQSVTAEVLGEGVGYVRIRHFQEDTTEELTRQLKALRKKGALERLVLDLRQNPGGLLEQAVEVAKLFIRKGVIVVTEGKGNRMREEYQADGDAPFANLPMVVLVDSGSASAAEIVAGALKGNDRAMLIGDTTFGKGTVQVMFPVEDGALKLTVAQYLTPGDISIQGVGVTPDIDVDLVTIGRERIELKDGESKRDRDETRVLEPFGKVSHEQPIARVSVLRMDNESKDDGAEDDEPPLKDDEKFERDEYIELAYTLARATKSATRSGSIKDSLPALKDWMAKQDSLITTALTERGIDWTPGPVQPGATVRLSFFLDKPQPLLAGSKVKLRVSARNEGRDPLYRVYCLTSSDALAMDAKAFLLGRIGPGETVTREVVTTVPKDSWDRIDEVAFRLFQGDFEMPTPESVRVATRSLLRPRFAYSWQLQDISGNQDGQLSIGESARVIFDISNIGEGVAQKVLVTLRNKSGEGLYVRDGRVTFDKGVPIGATVQAPFTVELKRQFKGDSVKFEISILDLALHEFLSDEIVLPVVPNPASRIEDRNEALRTLHDGVDILSAAALDAPVLMKVPANFFLRSKGRIGEFFRVDLDEGRFAFVRGADVELINGVVRFSPLPETPIYRRIQPVIDVVFNPADKTLTILGNVKFQGQSGEARRKVLIYRGQDKVYFWTHAGASSDVTVPIESKIQLTQGRNDIAIYAVEGKNRASIKRYTIFSDGGSKSSEPMTNKGNTK